MPLRDRAFSWDVSLEDGLHGENMHLFAPTTTYEHNNPKLVIKAKRMQVTKVETADVPLVPIKVEKDVKKLTINNKTNLATKRKDGSIDNDSSSIKNDVTASPKLSFVLSKSSSSNYTLKNINSSSNSGNTTALAMKPPTRLPSQGNASAVSRMSAANNKLTHVVSSTDQQMISSDALKAMSPAITTSIASTTPIESSVNNYITQLQQEQPQLARHNAEIAEEIQALFNYAGGAGDEVSDQMFDNSVRNLERIMMHPDESDEDHQRRHAMETLQDQQNFAASSPSTAKSESSSAQQAQTPMSMNSSMVNPNPSSSGKGSLQGVGGLAGHSGSLGIGQMSGIRPMILDGLDRKSVV